MLFVIDTWVLGRASDGNILARKVLMNVYNNNHKICVDKAETGSKILKEYKSIKGFSLMWYKYITTRKKKIKKIIIKNKCKNILRHRKDMKFVYVCLNCKCKDIVSEHYHFVKNEDQLKCFSIDLRDLNTALVMSQ